MNNIQLYGRLTREPELRVLQSGTSVVKFGIAVDRGLSKAKKQEAQANGQPTADFFDCTAFGALADTIANYVDKGSRVNLTGRLQSRSYQAQDGRNVKAIEVVVDGVDIIDFKNTQAQIPDGWEVSEEDVPW